MPSMFWYILVVSIGIALVVFAMYKKKNVLDLLSFFLSATSLGYICEVFVLFVFSSYAYKPGISKDPVVEDLIGHLLCNGFFWGGTAVFVAAFSLRHRYILLFSLFYVAVEILFLKLGIYEHHWWRLYMTGIGSFIFFSLIKFWFSLLQKNKYKFVRYATFYLTAWVLLQATTVLLLLFGKQHFHVGWVENMYQDDALFSVTYQLALSYVYVIFGSILKKWPWKIVPLIVTIIMDSWFVYMNILVISPGWSLFYLALLRSAGLIVFLALDTYTLRFDKQRIFT